MLRRTGPKLDVADSAWGDSDQRFVYSAHFLVEAEHVFDDSTGVDCVVSGGVRPTSAAFALDEFRALAIFM